MYHISAATAAVVFKGQFSAMTWAVIWCQFGQQQAARQQEAVNRAQVTGTFYPDGVHFDPLPLLLHPMTSVSQNYNLAWVSEWKI